MAGACSIHARDEKHIDFWLVSLKERDHSKDTDAEHRTSLKTIMNLQILKKDSSMALV